MIPQLPIAVTRPAGNPLAIVWFVLEITDGDGRVFPVEPTPEAIEKQVRAHFPDFESWVRCDNDPRDFPSEMAAFRRAWRLDGARIVIDLEDARALHRERTEQRAQAAVSALAGEFASAALADDAVAIEALKARRKRLLAASGDERIVRASSLAELAALDPLVDD